MAPGKEEPQRAAWGSKLDFILSCLGFAVGLGNVWRFPYLCGRNGGAAFLIPYVICMIFAGFPMFYIELSLAQYVGSPPHQLYYKISPIFQGVGYAMILVVCYVAFYYNMIIGWALYYFAQSCQKTLPFGNCNNTWNTEKCYDHQAAVKCADSSVNGTYCLGQCFPDSASVPNWTACSLYLLNTTRKVTPASEFWNFRALGISTGIDQMGYPRWELILCLAAAWIVIFITQAGGIKTAGKAVYFTATFPYVIIIILIVRGCTLSGAIDGVNFYIFPNMTRLTDAQVWGDACAQIFFSLGVSMGGLPTLASYNDFHHNIMRDTIIVVIGNCITSFICGFALFPIIGHLAYQTGDSVSSLASQGIGLAFETYPAALVQIPIPQLWSALFFVMLMLLGICTEQVFAEVILTAIVDQWPALREKKRRLLTTFLVCLGLFAIGICLTCPGGAYVVQLLDKFAAGWSLLIVALFEVIMVAYIYGIGNFITDIKLMLGKPPNMCAVICGYPVNAYWVINWLFITPGLLICVLLYNFISYQPPMYGDSYTYPYYAQVIGWIITASPLIPIAGFAIWRLQAWINDIINFDINGPILKKTPEWRPNSTDAEERKARLQQLGSIRNYQNLDEVSDPGYAESIASTTKSNKSSRSRFSLYQPPQLKHNKVYTQQQDGQFQPKVWHIPQPEYRRPNTKIVLNGAVANLQSEC